MRKLALAFVLAATGCASSPPAPCPPPRGLVGAPQRNSVVLQRENLIPVHVSYVDLPYIEAGAVLQEAGGQHVLYRGVPPDSRAQVAAIDGPPPAAPLPPPAPPTPAPAKPQPAKAAQFWPKHKASHKARACQCPAEHGPATANTPKVLGKIQVAPGASGAPPNTPPAPAGSGS